ncbi:hypothetical protein Tco_0545814 [Tanacetum coccineum]
MSMWIISRGVVLLYFDGYRVLRDSLLHRSSINNSASLSNKFRGFYFSFKFGISSLLHQVITTIADRIRELLEFIDVHNNDASESSQPSWGKCYSANVRRIVVDFSHASLNEEKELEKTLEDLAHSSLLRLRFFSPTWKVLMTYLVKCLGGNQGLNIDISGILYDDLISKLTAGRKKGMEKNIYYTRYLSLVMEHLLGKDYVNKDLFAINSYQITGATFKQSSIFEVPLTSYMHKIAKLDEEPLITPFEEANIEASSDMSLSGTSIHPVQENIVTEDEHIADEQHDDTKFVDSGILSMDDVSSESLNKATDESPYDTESEVKFVKRFKPVPNDEEPLFKSVSNKESDTKEDSKLALILDDEVGSPSAFQTSESEEESQSEPPLSKSKERDDDYVLDEINDLQASTDKPTDTTSHLQAEITSLSTKVN